MTAPTLAEHRPDPGKHSVHPPNGKASPYRVVYDVRNGLPGSLDSVFRQVRHSNVTLLIDQRLPEWPAGKAIAHPNPHPSRGSV